MYFTMKIWAIPFKRFKVSRANTHNIEIPVEINDIRLLMEIDTVAGISIISKETFIKNFNNVSLKPSGTRSHIYTGDHIKVCGHFDARVNYNHQSVILPLIVVDGSGPSLFDTIRCPCMLQFIRNLKSSIKACDNKRN